MLAKIRRDINVKSTDEFFQDYFFEWIAEAEEEIGSRQALLKKNTQVQVNNRVAPLPCDLVKLEFVSFKNSALHLNSTPLPYAASSDIYQPINNGFSTIGPVNNRFGNQKFFVNGDTIQVNMPDGCFLDLSYLAIPVDLEGYPLIKNTIQHKEAILAYCSMKWFYREFLMGQINPQVYKSIQMDWYNKRDKAQAYDNYPNTIVLEDIKRIWMRILPQTKSYDNMFLDRGENSVMHRNY